MLYALSFHFNHLMGHTWVFFLVLEGQSIARILTCQHLKKKKKKNRNPPSDGLE